MNIIELINENFAAIVALLGVIIGAVGTYLAQSKLLNKQREWALDDQKRKWQRDRLLQLLKLTNKTASILDQIRIRMLSNDKAMKAKIPELAIQLADNASEIDPSFDDELDKLYGNFLHVDMKLIMDGELGSLPKLHKGVIDRINVLLGETYK